MRFDPSNSNYFFQLKESIDLPGINKIDNVDNSRAMSHTTNYFTYAFQFPLFRIDVMAMEVLKHPDGYEPIQTHLNHYVNYIIVFLHVVSKISKFKLY